MKGLDTNVLVRYLVEDDQRQAEQAARYIHSANRCRVSLVVLCELVWVLESAYDYSRAVISDTLEKILTTSQFEVEAKDLAWAALRDYQALKIDFAVAAIVRGNESAGCSETGTFDKRLRALRTARVL